MLSGSRRAGPSGGGARGDWARERGPSRSRVAGPGWFHFAPRRHWVTSCLELCGPCRLRRHRISAAALRTVPHLHLHNLCRSPPPPPRRPSPALVPPMSDSDSRTEKRKVNTPRFAIPGGARRGPIGRQAPQAQSGFICLWCRTCGWRRWFVPLGARLQEANAASRAEVPAWQGTSGKGS